MVFCNVLLTLLRYCDIISMVFVLLHKGIRMKYLKVIVTCLLFVVTIFAQAAPLPLKPDGFVNDLALQMSKTERDTLNNTLSRHQDSKKVTIVVLTIPSAEKYGYSGLIEMGVAVFDMWKIGDKNLDSGILVLVSGTAPPYKVRIVTGRGMEGSVPDIIAKDIIETKMKPLMHGGGEGAYSRGLTHGVHALVLRTSQGSSKSLLVSPLVEDEAVDPASLLIFAFSIFVAFLIIFGVIKYQKKKRQEEESQLNDARLLIRLKADQAKRIREEAEFERQSFADYDHAKNVHKKTPTGTPTYVKSSLRVSSTGPTSSRPDTRTTYESPRVERRSEDDDDTNRRSFQNNPFADFGSSNDDSNSPPSAGGSTAGGGGGDD